MRFSMPTHSATTLEFWEKNLGLALAFPSEGHPGWHCCAPPPGILSYPPQEAMRKTFVLPSRIILGFLASPVTSRASFLLFQKNPCLPIKACTCSGSGLKTLLQHRDGRPQAFLETSSEPSCRGRQHCCALPYPTDSR